jgi:NAD(P)H-dependent FMN reductase
VQGSHGIVISCPEYAHGVPGSFKNALDWLVSSADLKGKPIVLLNASPVGGEFAQPSLAETLTMLGAVVLPESRLKPFLPPAVWTDGPDEATRSGLRAALDALLLAMREVQHS